MKVKIITRHAVANYGSILQAYATQKVMENLGCESEIINYVRTDEQGLNISDTMLRRNARWNRNAVTRLIYKMLQTPVYNGTYQKFKKYREDFLVESEKLYSTDEELKELPEADIYCTGSDQVWGSIGNVQFDPNYFLEFVPEGKKCISVAASFGSDSIPECLSEELPKMLKKYSDITVRESSAVQLLDKLGMKSKQMLDPTLLLERSEWEKICDPNIKEKGYVLIYQLHEDKKLEQYAEDFAKSVGKPLIRISISWLYRFKSGKLAYMPSPQKFLTYFSNCDYVVTDSFHATVFSIMFNKKFIDILPQNTGTRIVSLLSLLGISERIVSDYSDMVTPTKDIDYTVVNKILAEERKKSLCDLERMIRNTDKMN